MRQFKNPTWINDIKFEYESFDQIPAHVFDQINRDLDKVQSKQPLVSIVMSAWNEEVNLLRTIASMSRMKTKYPFEIIVINNNSQDRTQDTMDRLHVKRLFQPKQGCGFARQMGMEHAAGKYILLADADCYYPSCWIDEMIDVLTQPDVVCVYGRYSFISEKGFPRWKLSLLELMKDAFAEIRHIKRPYYNSFGLSMGFIKEYGMKIGFVPSKWRGDDGMLCLGLMKYGKIKQVRSNKARIWTAPRTLQRSGSFSQVLKERILIEAKRFKGNFNNKMPKDLSMQDE
ncbi:glycosyltransferase family 2 protein [Rufibacter tibetensis]|uniref:Glycosyl transferase n=1 Tax=Rufibacter tibetensis TaxID=512763 RepID=A0A0P0C453_9BACT|nr:glycosyltransferase family 2 protein [Rufibacter tibetensis]ALI99886.1 glycosyl transferase [Rufibacter tibetensis]